MVPSNGAVIQRLPNEVLDLIIDLLADDKSTLLSLCRTSRVLLPVAQPILFRRSDLTNQPMRSVRSWCHAVSQHAHVATRVRVLRLRLPLLLDAEDPPRIAQALSACSNLDELAVLSDSAEELLGDDPWMLLGHKFQLTKFTNSYFCCCEELYTFLATQKNIEYLRLPESTLISLPLAFLTKSESAEEPLLPKLITISTPIGSLPPNRLQRIQTTIRGSVAGLRFYASSLTTLNIIGNIHTLSMEPEEIVHGVGILVPTLRHLAVAEQRKAYFGLQPCRSPVLALARYTQLETFTLFTYNIIFQRNGEFVTEPDAIQALADECLEALSSLRRVVLQLDRRRAYFATRDAAGDVRSFDEPAVDFETLSMLWV